MKADAKAKPPSRRVAGIEKSPSGISGFDEVTYGGLPKGRPTLLCGSAGCGKTLFGTTFLYYGAVEYHEPGVFMTFEEQPEELVKNVCSLGYDLQALIAQKKLAVDHVHFEPAQIAEAGDYDLEGLFIRLAQAIDSVGAKRVVIDTVEMLFGGLQNQALLRSELRRLFEWLKAKKRHRDRHSRAWGGYADALWAGRICSRLRDPARQQGPRTAFDTPLANHQVSWIGARQQ